jgi:hypothetical protein
MILREDRIWKQFFSPQMSRFFEDYYFLPFEIVIAAQQSSHSLPSILKELPWIVRVRTPRPLSSWHRGLLSLLLLPAADGGSSRGADGGRWGRWRLLVMRSFSCVATRSMA